MKEELREAIRRDPKADVIMKRLRLYKQYQKHAEKRKRAYKESWSTEEFVKKCHPNDYRAILKKMEQNRLVLNMERRCLVCGGDDINTLGTLVEMCRDDMEAMMENFGKVVMVSKRLNIVDGNRGNAKFGDCSWCGKKHAKNMYTVNIYACEHCMRKIGGI